MPDSLLDDLNPPQRQAVTAPDGQILVLAGPGSGKTRVLTRRLAYLIDRVGVPSYDIIAVTFTNKAAREMENRVINMVQRNLEGIWLGTFHAMCARLLRRESAALPFSSNFVIFDSSDQESLVKRALRELNIDDKTHRPAGVLAAISAAKNDLLLPKAMPLGTYRDEVVSKVYTRYQEMLQTNNAVDFDDLLLLSARLLQENPAISEKYAHRFQHVLVDEFQDTNLAQYELLKHLAAYHKNIFVVGDEDQSIYRWRGADYRNVQRFEKDYPKCEKILLEQNYRSTQIVLDAARQVIDRNRNRTPKHLFTDHGAGNKIVQFIAVDDLAEAGFVVDTIQQYVHSRKASANDFAIMYRTNAQSRVIEEAFIHANLPYRLIGAQRFYGRREVKDLICFLRLIENPSDEVSLLRVIAVPPRGIGNMTILSLQNCAFQAGISAGEVLMDLGKNGDVSPNWQQVGRSAGIVSDFGALLNEWQAAKSSLSIVALFDRIIHDVGYEAYINDFSEEGNDRWENVQELRRLAGDFQDKGLTEFLQNLALVSDQDTIPDNGESSEMDKVQGAVTLLTLHAAKGLEYNQVFILGLDEGLLPHSRSRDDPEEMAEERRLFYVGMTRAKNQLYLLRAERRSNFGSWEYGEASRFLADINEDLVVNQGRRNASRRDVRQEDFRWSKTGVTTTQRVTTGQRGVMQSFSVSVEPRFKPGMRVRSANKADWGEGMVLESKMDPDGEETVNVHFESVGLKRLLASLANLEIIS
ncbi:MAG: DNA helicase II / ATP-dependent DNA helicase PcrA [Chloroflexi bacterium]|nr:MAG: DNA helicase II / ATP-dependent DNA helicase PcrA [Chloroflexota bacterium]